MQKHHFAIVALILVAAAGGSFYGGEAYAKSKTPTFAGRAAGQGQLAANGARRGGLMPNGSTTDGDVMSKDDKSLTIKLRDGGSKIVFFSDSTMVAKTVDAQMDDVTEGTHVLIVGSANTDGSVTAKTIQIRPASPAPAAKK